jgi:hypothetical protein
VPDTPDKAEGFKRLLLNKRKRTLLHLMRMLEAKAASMAGQAARPRRRRRGPQTQPKPFNPVTELRRELWPMIEELVRLAGTDTKPVPKTQGPKRRRLREPQLDR